MPVCAVHKTRILEGQILQWTWKYESLSWRRGDFVRPLCFPQLLIFLASLSHSCVYLNVSLASLFVLCLSLFLFDVCIPLWKTCVLPLLLTGKPHSNTSFHMMRFRRFSFHFGEVCVSINKIGALFNSAMHLGCSPWVLIHQLWT